MRIRRPLASPLYPKIGSACTDHPITVWAGTVLLRPYCKLFGLQAGLMPLLGPFARSSAIRFQFNPNGSCEARAIIETTAVSSWRFMATGLAREA
ncbi:MAG TPA: hypothetical protein PKD12_09105 [Nitrospira sp.]|nr:hypothetical protein [Nitrospira sp.]